MGIKYYLNIFDVLFQPWASWIMKEWETIETRTHNRFASLKGKTILIHAGKTTDYSAFKNAYLPEVENEKMINGFILGSVFCL